MHMPVPNTIAWPKLAIPWCFATIKLPNPAMVVSAETNTAFPVLRPKMLGFSSSANRFKM